MKIKSSKESQMIITKRDIKVLKAIFKNKVATLKQIHKAFFPNTNITNVARFMRRLKGSEYVLSRRYDMTKRSQNIYSITSKGLSLICEFLGLEVEFNSYKSSSILHDLELFNISEHFKKFQQVNKIYYESELQSNSIYLHHEYLNPFVNLKSDRVLKVEVISGEAFLALEYERVLKERNRNVRKFENYYDQDKISGVLYLCENNSMIDLLMQIDKEVCPLENSKMYFCNIEDVKNKSNQITFKRFDGHKLIFKMSKTKTLKATDHR